MKAGFIIAVVAFAALAVIGGTGTGSARAESTGPDSEKCARDRAEFARQEIELWEEYGIPPDPAGPLTPISCVRGGAAAVIKEWEESTPERKRYLEERKKKAEAECRRLGYSGSAFRHCVEIRD